MGELFTKSAPIIKREAQKTSAKRSSRAQHQTARSAKSSLRSKREKFLRGYGGAFYKKRLNKCTALTCAKRINKREAQKINPCGLRADTLLIPAVAHCPQGAALCRTGQTSRTGRTDLVCRYNSAFTPELAVSGSVCKLNPAACDVANGGTGFLRRSSMLQEKTVRWNVPYGSTAKRIKRSCCSSGGRWSFPPDLPSRFLKN